MEKRISRHKTIGGWARSNGEQLAKPGWKSEDLMNKARALSNLENHATISKTLKPKKEPTLLYRKGTYINSIVPSP